MTIGVFINFSNHPSNKWGEKQLQEAKLLACGADIVDIPFPIVPPAMKKDALSAMVDKYVKIVLDHNPMVVHIMGEMGFVYKFVKIMHVLNVMTVHSTTDRIVVEKDGQKISTFEFVQFREY